MVRAMVNYFPVEREPRTARGQRAFKTLERTALRRSRKKAKMLVVGGEVDEEYSGRV
jgi:hypothetical protein